MAGRRQAQISTRKEPQQARSNDLMEAVLKAAIQVLASEGAHGFTTAKVAARAGVSVGSLYQYFPNKAAILFRLQSDEWRQTSDLLRDILEDRSTPPFDRLRAVVRAFLRSECEEAGVRMALDDAAPLYRDAPEAREAQHAGAAVIDGFMAEALPDVAEARRALVTDLIGNTLSQVGKRFSETPRSETDIAAYADAMADMFVAFLSAEAAAG